MTVYVLRVHMLGYWCMRYRGARTIAHDPYVIHCGREIAVTPDANSDKRNVRVGLLLLCVYLPLPRHVQLEQAVKRQNVLANRAPRGLQNICGYASFHSSPNQYPDLKTGVMSTHS